MDTESLRTCGRDGCENPVTGKATAKYCCPSCRREQNRANGDGDENRIWVKGHWKQRPRKRSAAPRRTRTADPALTLICAALVIAAGQERPQEHVR